jgi:hypothetical protein
MSRKSVLKINFPVIVSIAIINLANYNCSITDIFKPGDGGGDGYKKAINPKDSIAIRAILNLNGLDSVKIKNVVVLSNVYINSIDYSILTQINFDSLSLNKFIFSKYFDSLSVSPVLTLRNNNIDTLIFPDTIITDIGISLEYNHLRSLSKDVDKMIGSLSLNLNFNELTLVNQAIMHCKISYLNINYNQLCSVPDSIAQWITLNCRDSTWRSTQTCP